MSTKPFDPEDPLALCRVGIVTDEDTTNAMAECLVEEYLRLGYQPAQLLALFQNPFYTGLHLVLQRRGEAHVRALIADRFARWGRPCVWNVDAAQVRSTGIGTTPPADHAVAGQDQERSDQTP
jgi:hypothetical protein